MKNILYTLIAVAMFGSMHGQNYKGIKVIYKKGYKNFKDSSATKPKLLKGLEYTLDANLIESRFESINKIAIEGRETNKRFLGKGGGKGVFYKNLKTKEKLWLIEDYGDTFLVVEKFNKYNWELLKNESKLILGYPCYKAIGRFTEYSPIRKKTIEHEIEAWYSPSLPIPFGPSGFDGLPGLVLESRNGSFYFLAQDILLKQKESKIKKTAKGKKVTLDEFNRLIFKYFQAYTK